MSFRVIFNLIMLKYFQCIWDEVKLSIYQAIDICWCDCPKNMAEMSNTKWSNFRKNVERRYRNLSQRRYSKQLVGSSMVWKKSIIKLSETIFSSKLLFLKSDELNEIIFDPVEECRRSAIGQNLQIKIVKTRSFVIITPVEKVR